jgi:hypothetical protein
LTPTSTPAALRNFDSLAANFTIDQIVQLTPNGAMRFRLTFPVWVVRASDTAAVIQFDGTPFNVFRSILTANSTHTVAVADTQFTAAGRTRQTFVSWSDGGAISHSFLAGATPETLTVTLARSHKISYSATSGGTITPSVPSDTFVAEGTPVTLTANDTSAARIIATAVNGAPTNTEIRTHAAFIYAGAGATAAALRELDIAVKYDAAIAARPEIKALRERLEKVSMLSMLSFSVSDFG